MNKPHVRNLWGGLLPLAGIILALLLSACATTANAANPAGATPTPTAPTPQPALSPSNIQVLSLLLKSAQAMQKVTSVHIDVSSHGTVASSGGTLPSPPPQPVAYTLGLQANVAVASRQERGKLQLTLNQQKKTTLTLSEAVSGQKLYYKVNTPSVQQGNQAPGWMVIDLATLVSQQQVSTAAMRLQDLLPLLVQHVMIADQGTARSEEYKFITSP